MSSPPEPVGAWFQGFVTAESTPAMIDAWVDHTTGAILAEIPEVTDDAVIVRLLRTSVQAHWMAFLNELTSPSTVVHLVKPAVEFAAELARRQFDLTTLVKVYQIARHSTWKYVTEVVRDRETREVDETEVLVHLWGRASAWIDASVSASLDVYQAERDRIRRSTAAQRLEWVKQALDGRLVDSREFSARIGGYPVSAFNIAFVLHTRDDDAVAELDRVAAQLAADLGSHLPLVVVPGGRELWCWAGTRARPDPQVLTRREKQLRDQRIEAYVGTPGEGLEGFALSHREARVAQRIAFQSQQPRAMTLFTDIELLSLISQSPEGATRFALRTLGRLAEPCEAAQRLRETLDALLFGGSVDEAARRLSVHKNTVRYRVSQAEEMLGHPVSQAQVELALALRYHAAFIDTGH